MPLSDKVYCHSSSFAEKKRHGFCLLFDSPARPLQILKFVLGTIGTNSVMEGHPLPVSIFASKKLQPHTHEQLLKSLLAQSFRHDARQKKTPPEAQTPSQMPARHTFAKEREV